jgi:hypothetical protein
MRCDLTDEEDAALARLLSGTINDDRYLLLARIRACEEDPRQDPAAAVTCTTAAPIRHGEIHRAYKREPRKVLYGKLLHGAGKQTKRATGNQDQDGCVRRCYLTSFTVAFRDSAS